MEAYTLVNLELCRARVPPWDHPWWRLYHFPAVVALTVADGCNIAFEGMVMRSYSERGFCSHFDADILDYLVLGICRTRTRDLVYETPEHGEILNIMAH